MNDTDKQTEDSYDSEPANLYYAFKQKPPTYKWWERIYYPIYRFVKNITWLHRRIYWKLQQHTRGYSDSDLWDVGPTTGLHTLKCLKAFRKIELQGYPAGYNEEQWNKIRDDMIEGLDFILNGTDRIKTGIDWVDGDRTDLLTCKEYARLYPKMEKKAILYIKHINALWD